MGKRYDYKIINKSRLIHYCDKCGGVIPIGSSYVRGTRELDINYDIRCYHRECFYPNLYKGGVKVEDKRITELRKEIERNEQKIKCNKETIDNLIKCNNLYSYRITISKMDIDDIENGNKELERIKDLEKELKELKEQYYSRLF